MTDAVPTDLREQLLSSARRARQQGDHAGARALLRALVARYPHDARMWLLLATVAQNRAEQQHAFEHVLALDPNNGLAQRGLEAIRRTAVALPATPPVAEPHPTIRAPIVLQHDTAPVAEAEQARALRWPMYALIGAALVICLVAGGFILRPQSANHPILEPVAAVVTSQPTIGAQLVATVLAAPTIEPVPTILGAEATVVPLVPAAAANLATSQPAQPTLAPAFGQIASAGVWQVGLLRPQDAVLLSGSIGELQPQGRFVLALVAVSNASNGERQLPADLLALVDASGQRYGPLPAASTAYMQVYGNNQAGVVGMEQMISPNLGIVSVPVIFDVPATARSFKLVVGASGGGWAIAE